MTLTLANTEYSASLSDVRQVSFKARQESAIRFAFRPGKVASSVEPYLTLPSLGTFDFPEKYTGDPTIYFASGDAGTVVEIAFWRKVGTY